MSEVREVEVRYCCEDDCYEEMYEEEGDFFPFELWPRMRFPSMVYTRWRLSKLLDDEVEAGESATPVSDTVWPRRIRQSRVSMSSLPVLRQLRAERVRAAHRPGVQRRLPLSRLPDQDGHAVVPSRRRAKVVL